MNRRALHLAVLAALLATSSLCVSQENDKQEARASDKANVTWHYYKLNFVLKETDEGKPVNQRAFTLGVTLSATRSNDSDRSSLRAGTRLPLMGDKEVHWVDIGTNLDVYRVTESAEALQMSVTAEISSLADSGANAQLGPVRQVRASSSVLAPLSKPTVVFTADDPGSKHRFELDVTAVRER